MDEQQFIDELGIINDVEKDSLAHVNNELLIAHDVVKSSIKLLGIQCDKLMRLSEEVPEYSEDKDLKGHFVLGIAELQAVQKSIDNQLIESNSLLKRFKDYVAKNND